MSIHAQISPEAQARLAVQRRNSTILSGVIALLMVAIIGLLLGLFLLPSLVKETPTIVTYQANEAVAETPEPDKVKSSIQRKPTSPASTMARVIASAASSPVSIPVPDVAVDTESVDFGDAQDFGTGWGADLGMEGGGGGATFFNQSVKADRIAYVIDYSQSMKGERDALMRKELTKSISGIKAGTQFQMIFFAGPAWVAGGQAHAGGNQGTVKASGGRTIKWTGKGANHWTPVGNAEKAEWLTMTGNQMGKSLKMIEETKLVYGTDWTNPLEMAFEMEPTPQIIFFMTDGITGGDMMKLTDELAAKARRKGIMINSVALMEPKAEKPMFNLADKTGGAFTIVESGGKVREVKKIDGKKRSDSRKPATPRNPKGQSRFSSMS